MTPSESLKMMQEISNDFHKASCNTECHAFIEFTGLMNEYIKLCEEFQRANPDLDFRQYTGHSGQELQLLPHHKQYIREKLNCIYQEQLINN